jgi:hypothetical protein
MNSKLFLLNHKDAIKGLVTSVLTASVATLSLLVQNKGFDITAQDIKLVGVAAATAFLGYLLKQLGTDEKGKFLGKV